MVYISQQVHNTNIKSLHERMRGLWFVASSFLGLLASSWGQTCEGDTCPALPRCDGLRYLSDIPVVGQHILCLSPSTDEKKVNVLIYENSRTGSEPITITLDRGEVNHYKWDKVSQAVSSVLNKRGGPKTAKWKYYMSDSTKLLTPQEWLSKQSTEDAPAAYIFTGGEW